MHVIKRVMAATVAASLAGCAGMGEFCNNQPWICGGVVIAAGFAIALVELLGFPKGSVWAVAASALLVVLLIRRLGR